MNNTFTLYTVCGLVALEFYDDNEVLLNYDFIRICFIFRKFLMHYQQQSEIFKTLTMSVNAFKQTIHQSGFAKKEVLFYLHHQEILDSATPIMDRLNKYKIRHFNHLSAIFYRYFINNELTTCNVFDTDFVAIDA
jgi:hypothetical protein